MVSIADPANLTVAGVLQDSRLALASDIEIAGDYTYVSLGSISGGVVVVSIADIGNLTIASVFEDAQLGPVNRMTLRQHSTRSWLSWTSPIRETSPLQALSKTRSASPIFRTLPY